MALLNLTRIRSFMPQIKSFYHPLALTLATGATATFAGAASAATLEEVKEKDN
jgi:hypothetical protein